MSAKSWLSLSLEHEYKIVTSTQKISWESSSEDEATTSSTETKLHFSPTFSLSKRSNCLNTLHSNTIESPEIKFLNRSSDISPELSQKMASTHFRVPSPIIPRLRLRKKHKYPRIKSPELVNPTQMIECETENYVSQAIKIEQVSSQLASPIEKENNTDIDLLYYQPPKRKKTYKKGSLAHQLQITLKHKKSRVKMWYHEKLKNVDCPCPLDHPEDIIKFTVQSFWMNYGVTLAICDLTSGLFVLNLGARQILKIELECNRTYQLYPPYEKDFVIYQGKKVPHYYNVSKIALVTS